MTESALGPVLASTDTVLFDFDGPICSVFAGYPASGIAAELLRLLPDHDATFETDDPLEVLRQAVHFGQEVVNRVESALVAAEQQAVRSAAATPGGAASLRAGKASGRRTAIVSNNSADAIRQYLAGHDLTQFVEVVVGRTPGRPGQMKPSPEPLARALRELSVGAAGAVLVGDSATDLEAARAAGVACIGLANKPAKWHRLAGAELVLGDMTQLAEQLGAVAAPAAPQRG